MSILSRAYRKDETVFSMQFLADIIKKMNDKNIIKIEDLYNLSEKEVIEKIEKCDYGNISRCFKIWRNATQINTSNELPNNKYCVNIEKTKVRYINPLVKLNGKYTRIYNISDKAKADIKKALNYKITKYKYLDFEF